MPKTKEQIEQLVRDFYETLTSADFEDTSIEDAPIVNFEVTEEEIQMAINSYSADGRQEIAQKYLDLRVAQNDVVNELETKYAIMPEYRYERTVQHMMDTSGTEAAEKKNVELLRKVSTREGYKDYLQQQIDLAAGFDISIMANSNAIDGAQLFFDPEVAPKLQALFICQDILGDAEKLGLEVPQETADHLQYNMMVIASSMSAIGTVQKALSKDDFACINTEINAVKQILAEPDRYSTLNGSTAFDMITMDYVTVSGSTRFSDMDPAYKLDQIIEANHLPKTPVMLESFTEGKAAPYKTEDGTEMMAAYTEGNVMTWTRTIPDCTITENDSYEAVRAEGERLFAAIEAEGLVNEDVSPEFRKVLEQVNKIHGFYAKNMDPADPRDRTDLMQWFTLLGTAVGNVGEKLPADKMADPVIRKQIELCDALGKFEKTEALCRKRYEAALPENVFAGKLKALLSRPEYDFDVNSRTDSLRLRSFALYKNADSDQIQEKTDYLLTNYEGRGMSHAEFDSLIKNDAYEFLRSQSSLSQNSSEANLAVWQNARSGSAVIYPKSGDASRIRMLYIDKNGEPRLSPPLIEMPNLGETMIRMDALRKEGKGFADFPEADTRMHGNLSEEEIAKIAQNVKDREAMAMPVFIQDCAAFFPDAADPELLVQNALYYSAARQNFAMSSYGEVYITEAQTHDPSVRQEAAAQKEKAIAEVLAQREIESNIIKEAGEHPEYYAKKELAAERMAIYKAHAMIEYELEPEKTDANIALYRSHNMDMASVLEAFLKENGLKPEDIRFYDVNAAELGTGKDAKPWDKLEKAAGMFEKDEPLYFSGKLGGRVRKIELLNGEFRINAADAGAAFRDPADAAKRAADLENIESLYNRMTATGTTRRDSAEYTAMVAAVKEALETARACNVDQASPKALIARDRLDAAKAKLADAADKYFVAKVDGSMNSRRTARFAVAMVARHLTDDDYSAISHDPGRLLKEAVATKLCRAEAKRAIAENAVNAGDARSVLGDRKVLRNKASAMMETDAFRSLTAKPGELNKLFGTDPEKLLVKFEQKAAPAKKPQARGL